MLVTRSVDDSGDSMVKKLEMSGMTMNIETQATVRLLQRASPTIIRLI